MREGVRPEIPTKSGLMVGLGETDEEVMAALQDLRAHGVTSRRSGSISGRRRRTCRLLRHVTPETFEEYKRAGMEMGFAHVESGPLVRSSYHAAEAL